jgi:5-methylcytosine-specific restriction protein A
MPYINKRRIGKPNHKEENIQRRNEKWGHYYGSKKWKLLRDYYKRLHPLCENCAIEGRSVPAEHVHHKCPFSWFDLESDRIAALYDIDNLQCLCRECHQNIHKNLFKPSNFEETDYYKKIHNS